MSPRVVEDICRDMAAIERDLGDLKPGSARRPHDFPEAILSFQKRLRALQIRVRQSFSGRVVPNSLKSSEIERVFGR